MPTSGKDGGSSAAARAIVLQVGIFVAIAFIGGVWGTMLRQSSDVESFVQTLAVLSLAAAGCLYVSGRRLALLVHWLGVLGAVGYVAMAPSAVHALARLGWLALLIACGLFLSRRTVRESLR